jgi:hypothetical protein
MRTVWIKAHKGGFSPVAQFVNYCRADHFYINRDSILVGKISVRQVNLHGRFFVFFTNLCESSATRAKKTTANEHEEQYLDYL